MNGRMRDNCGKVLGDEWVMVKVVKVLVEFVWGEVVNGVEEVLKGMKLF